MVKVLIIRYGVPGITLWCPRNYPAGPEGLSQEIVSVLFILSFSFLFRLQCMVYRFKINLSPFFCPPFSLFFSFSWRRFLLEEISEQKADEFRLHERTGRPLGSESFVAGIEKVLSRILRRQKPGPKQDDNNNVSMVSPEFSPGGEISFY